MRDKTEPDPLIPVATSGAHCRHCGYDVRGLNGAVCPECGRNFFVSEVVGRLNGATRAQRAVKFIIAMLLRPKVQLWIVGLVLILLVVFLGRLGWIPPRLAH